VWDKGVFWKAEATYIFLIGIYVIEHPEYRIFISYSRIDAPIVNKFVKLLSITDAAIFQDVHNISPGSLWRGVIADAIDTCEIFVLFWCKHSEQSPEVKKEYNRAVGLEKRIVPVLLDETSIPKTLAEYQSIDMTDIIFGSHIVIEFHSRLMRSLQYILLSHDTKTISECDQRNIDRRRELEERLLLYDCMRIKVEIAKILETNT
jgi:hypothetical protein